MSSAYNLLILDYGGVYSFEYDNKTPFRLARELFGAERPASHPPVLTNLENRFSSGQITTQEYIDELASIINAPARPTPEQLESAIVAASREPSPEMVRLVKEVRGKGIKTVLLSDVCSFEIPIGEQRRRYEGFDLALLSANEGMNKKTPAFFQRIFERTGYNSKEALFVDDSKYCIETAQSLGISSLYVDKEAIANANQLANRIRGSLRNRKLAPQIHPQ